MVLSFLNSVRHRRKSISVRRQVAATVAILFLGIALGAFSKFLDNTASNYLPFITCGVIPLALAMGI